MIEKEAAFRRTESCARYNSRDHAPMQTARLLSRVKQTANLSRMVRVLPAATLLAFTVSLLALAKTVRLRSLSSESTAVRINPSVGTTAIRSTSSCQIKRSWFFDFNFVDAPEEERVYADRIAEQAAYFGISTDAAVEIGREASEFTKEALAKPFTIHTR
jgi:hypothetical protein